LSNEAWPSKYEYKCIDWSALNQKRDGDVIDMIGRVSKNPERELISIIPKMIVTLQNADFTTTVERDLISTIPKMKVTLENADFTTMVDFLGEQANKLIKINDVILLGGIRVSEFRNVRSLRTSWLTTVDINPATRPNIDPVSELDDNEPKRKAICMTQQNVCTEHDLQLMHGKMEQEAQDGKDVKEQIVTVTRELMPFKDDFFTGQAPIVGN